MTAFKPTWRDALLLLALTALILSGCRAGSGSDALPQQPPPPGPSTPPGPFDPFANTGVFLSVLPPGQSASESGTGQEDNFVDQSAMYENLVFTQAGELVTEDHLVNGGFFKDAAFLPPDSAEFVETVEVSNGDFTATIGFDTFGVPHVFGDTRDDVYFGSGYVTASDRTFVADVLRHVGRGRLSDFLGPTAGNFELDRDLGMVAGYDEKEIQGQIDQLSTRFGTTGEQIQADSAAFVAGYNTRLGEVRNTPMQPIEYTALNVPLRDWTVRDILAVATLVQATFAVGGGSEHRQVQLLNEIKQVFVDSGALTAREGCDLWRDLRHAEDPEKPTSAEGEFKTQSPPVIDEEACPFDAQFATNFPGAVLFDRSSLQARELLTIEDCSLVEIPELQPECPHFGESVVEEEVNMAASRAEQPATLDWQSLPTLLALLPAQLRPLFSGSASVASHELPPTPYRRDAAGQAAYQERLADAARRAQAQVAALGEALRFPEVASNALLINADHTEAGHPIAVFGPQTGYFVPNLLYEMSQQGGDVNVRGMTFAGLPYVVIGRGVDFAWSATSAGADIIDIRVLQLCEPPESSTPVSRDSRHYLHNGSCKAMFQRTDEWTAAFNPGAPPQPGDESLIGKRVTRHILRAPDYGPVFASATVEGAPVALAIQRSTFFGEVDSAVPFVATSRNDITDPQSFFEVFNTLTGTFNWFYVDADNTAYFMSGLLPVRAPGIHPDLPSWGNGQFDWAQTGTGQLNAGFSFDNFLPLAAKPRDQNPAKGFMTSWNNAQARGFWANDGQTSYGPIYRSDLLDRRLQAFAATGKKHTPGSVVEIMIDAATTDLRGQEVLPSLLAVLDSATEPALSADQQNAVTIARNWVSNGTDNLGAMRRDRDGPGQDTAGLVYEDRAAVVFMDTWWDRMIDRALPQITALENSDNGNVMVGGRHDLPNDIGSAFQGGYYGYMRRVLDMALDSSAAPYRQLRCADGQLASCRSALITSIQDTLDTLGTDPDGWDGTDNARGSNNQETREQDDAIQFDSLGVAGVDDIHWQNRPTYQQVIQVKSRQAR